MASRYKKNERVGRSQVGKTTAAARSATRRTQKVQPTKVITMGKKIKVTSRTPRSMR